MTSFPLKIKYTRTSEEVVIQSPSELLSGEAFVVLETNYKEKPLPNQWKVQVLGNGSQRSGWEISVVHVDNEHGQQSYGWFGDMKYLVGHNGGPCNDYVCSFVWDGLLKLAEELCQKLNDGERVVR